MKMTGNFITFHSKFILLSNCVQAARIAEEANNLSCVFAGPLFTMVRDEMSVHLKRLCVATFLPEIETCDILFSGQDY